MDAWTKFFTAAAALVGAIAWPATLLFIVLEFRDVLRPAFGKITIMLDRVTKASVAGWVLELDRFADSQVKSDTNKEGKVTPEQVEAATRITAETRDVSSQALLKELDRLCSEYDSLRQTVAAGSARTQAMNRVVIKMRSLAPSVIDFLDVYKNSNSAGGRLAAIAMMQMVPAKADIEWLASRFSTETPFLFYQSALALQNLANNNFRSIGDLKKVRELAIGALSTVTNFTGIPDPNTITVLEGLISGLSKFSDE